MALSAGTTTTIDTSASCGLGGCGFDSARISDTRMLTVFQSDAAAGTLGARVVDINTTTKAITANAEYTTAHGFQMDELYLVRLSSTKFLLMTRVGRSRVINVSGTVVSFGPIAALTTFSGFGGTRFIPVSSTTALRGYSDGSDIIGRIVSIDGSDNVSEGAAVTIATATGAGINSYDLALFNSSTGCIIYMDDTATQPLIGQMLSISGTTLALTGGKQTIYSAKKGYGTVGSSEMGVAELSSTQIISAHNVDSTGAGGAEALICLIISLSGSSLTGSGTLELANTEFISPSKGAATNDTTFLFTGESGTTSRTTQVIKSGAALTHTASDFINVTIDNAARSQPSSIKKIADDFALVCTIGSRDGTVLGSDAALPVSGLALPGMVAKVADVDADGDNIYIALLDSGNPILVKFPTTLASDGTTVFNPGSGSNIGVECGRFDATVVWVAGAFDGTNVVEKSEDSGTSFTVKDDGTIGDVRSFVVGPDSDDRILLFDETNGDVFETIDSGDSWVTNNPAIAPEINTIARLGENVQEVVFGNDARGTFSIVYSPNSGGNGEDYQTGVYPSVDATKVIVN